MHHDLTMEGWANLRKQRKDLANWLNIRHSEVLSIGGQKPLEMALAQDVLRLVWIRAQNIKWAMPNLNCSVGFTNYDPKAKRDTATPYLKIDKDGLFSVGTDWAWWSGSRGAKRSGISK